MRVQLPTQVLPNSVRVESWKCCVSSPQIENSLDMGPMKLLRFKNIPLLLWRLRRTVPLPPLIIALRLGLYLVRSL